MHQCFACVTRQPCIFSISCKKFLTTVFYPSSSSSKMTISSPLTLYSIFTCLLVFLLLVFLYQLLLLFHYFTAYTSACSL